MEPVLTVQTGNDCGSKVNNNGEGSDKKMEHALRVKAKRFNV